MTHAPGARPYLFMLLAAFNLSTMAALSRGAGLTCDWRLVATARAGVMLLLALGLLLHARVRLPVFRCPPALWVRSISGSLGLLCTFYAVTHVGVSEALTLMNMYPLWVALLSWPVLGERPGRSVWVAIAVSITGIACIAQPQFGKAHLGLMAGVGNSFFTAIAMIGLHKAGSIDTRVVVAHFSLVATAVSGSLFLGPLLAGAPAPPISGTALLLLVGVGVTGTLGQLAMTKAFALGTPSKVALVALTQVAFGIGFDLVVWKRSFNSLTLIGIVLVLAPTAWFMAVRRRPVPPEETV